MEDYDWIIRNMRLSRKVSDIMLDGDLFWCTRNGWVDYSTCQVFTQEEKNTLDLPIDGVWEKL